LLKVWTTENPEEATRWLAARHHRTIVRRQRFFRPAIWFRPNLLKDLELRWYWDWRGEPPQKWDGILFHYPRDLYAQGLPADAHCHEQCPLTLRQFALHTALIGREAVIPLPPCWDHPRRTVSLLFPGRAIVEPVYDRIREHVEVDPSERQIAAAREAECDPRGCAFLLSDDLLSFVPIELAPREKVSLRRALFPGMWWANMPVIWPVNLRFRPFDEGRMRDAYDWMERQPMCSDGFRLISERRVRAELGHWSLHHLRRDGHVLTDPCVTVFDTANMNPDFGQIEQLSREKLRLLEGMIRFVESLPALPL
jgi:hypothetical protein